MMNDFKLIVMLAITGGMSGVARLFNNMLNNDNEEFRWWKLFARGIVGMVVGTIFSYMIYVNFGIEWAIPAAACGGWFPTEIMNMLESKISSKTKKHEQ